MFRPTSCLLSRGCTRAWIIDLLFPPRDLRLRRIQKAVKFFEIAVVLSVAAASGQHDRVCAATLRVVSVTP